VSGWSYCKTSYGQQPQAACDAPRWKVNRDFTIARQFFPMQDEWLSTLLVIGIAALLLILFARLVQGFAGRRRIRKCDCIHGRARTVAVQQERAKEGAGKGNDRAYRSATRG
jgi:hypothetical protein